MGGGHNQKLSFHYSQRNIFFQKECGKTLSILGSREVFNSYTWTATLEKKRADSGGEEGHTLPTNAAPWGMVQNHRPDKQRPFQPLSNQCLTLNKTFSFI